MPDDKRKKVAAEPPDESRNDLILQSIAEGICVVDAAEKITFSNRAADRMFGGQLAALKNKSYEEIFFQRVKNSTECCPIRFTLTEGETSHVQNETFTRLDGGELTVEYVCVPLVEAARISGAVITFEDVTERREIERAIAAVRDAALENARVRAAFLANMSHEIRTPLNGIVGATDLLGGTDLNGKQRHYVEMLKTSGALLLEIVGGILDYSKIEAGKSGYEAVEFQARKLFGETVELFTALAHEKKLRFDFLIDENIPEKLIGGGKQLRQVLNNLLSNAVKFTERGAINLQIKAAAETAERLTLAFEIADTGIGIDEKSLQNLFQPFVQADVSTTRRFGGTGLGLAICKAVVAQMNGAISVESAAGAGSRFRFTAEFLKCAADSETSAAAETIATPPTANRNLKILIVEDNPINREITAELLLQIGFAAECAENGAKALEKCAAARFDLILMDCQMPEMDGYEASEKILRASGDNNPPKIIALTANSTAAERAKSFAAGMVDFLTKPIDKNGLAAVVNKHFAVPPPAQKLDFAAKLHQDSLAEAIDSDSLKKLLEIEQRGSRNFLSEMLELYVGYTDRGLAEINSAFAALDAAAIKAQAHALKGSSANIGILKMPEMFEILAENVCAGDWTKIGRSILEINRQYETVKNILTPNI